MPKGNKKGYLTEMHQQTRRINSLAIRMHKGPGDKLKTKGGGSTHTKKKDQSRITHSAKPKKDQSRITKKRKK